MVPRFLNLFASYRSLVNELDHTSDRLIKAQDDARHWQARMEMAEESRDKALASAELNHKRVANWMALQQGSPNVPFPEAHVVIAPPESTVTALGTMPIRRQAREVQAEQVARTRRDVQDRLHKIMNPQPLDAA